MKHYMECLADMEYLLQKPGRVGRLIFTLPVLVMSCNHKYLNSTCRFFPSPLLDAIALAALEPVQTRTCALKPKSINIGCIPSASAAHVMTAWHSASAVLNGRVACVLDQCVKKVTLIISLPFCGRGEGVQGVLTLFGRGKAQACHDLRVEELMEQLEVEEGDGDRQEEEVDEKGEVESKRCSHEYDRG